MPLFWTQRIFLTFGGHGKLLERSLLNNWLLAEEARDGHSLPFHHNLVYNKKQSRIENRIKSRIRTSNKKLHPLLFLLFQPGTTLRVMSATLVTSRKEGEACWRKWDWIFLFDGEMTGWGEMEKRKVEEEIHSWEGVEKEVKYKRQIQEYREQQELESWRGKLVLMFEDGKGKLEWEKHNHCIKRGDGGEMLREYLMQVSLASVKIGPTLS